MKEYKDPEQQGKLIEKCTILKPIKEIEYSNHSKIDFDYDSTNDILYYSYGNTDNSYGDEDADNIILMKDINTEEITGITVLDFIRMYQEQDDRINIVSKYVDLPVVLKAII